MNSPVAQPHIVLVIDSPDIIELVRRILEPHGYTVVGSTSGEAERMTAQASGTVEAVIADDLANVPDLFTHAVVVYSSGAASARFPRATPLSRPFTVAGLVSALQAT